jgi:hypothetical protein
MRCKLLALSLIVAVTAYPSVTFDFNVTPNLACGIMLGSFSNAFVGISYVGDVNVHRSTPLQRTNNTLSSCPIGYCATISAPTGQQMCMEYPFPGTVENKLAGYACVTPDELKLQNNALADFYISKNINDGDMFHIKLINMDLETCAPIPFMTVDKDKVRLVNNRYTF